MTDRLLYRRALEGFVPFNDDASVTIDCSTETHPNTFITVSGEDSNWVMSRKWTPTDNGKGQIYFMSGKGAKVALHRQVARARFYETVDHIDGDTLNNQRSNLRLCTTAQNTWNQTKHKRGNTEYKGVHNVNGRFRSAITAGGTTYNLGVFDCPKRAALARDAAALYLHGEFAFLNFPNAGTIARKPLAPVRYKNGNR